MSWINILNLAGGLALFLYGMNMLGGGLEKFSGGRLERTLEKMTNNVIKSVLLGALVTAAIQSSSATTVIVVGLVNAGIMRLKQAIGVIMGANIGTTVTAQILALNDIDSSSWFLNLLKPSTITPLVAVIGILLIMLSKKDSRKNIGTILIGFSILFTGMFTMESSVSVLKDIPEFTQVFASLSNPFLGVLVGAVVTAIIQSSSASVGILQALASTGAITYSAAFPIILGQNIGTCITAILASIGTSKNARRAAVAHLYFNLIGTTVFLIGIYTFQYTVGFPFWSDPIGRSGIANFHLIFNVVTTLLFLPFTGLLEKLAIRTVPDKAGDTQTASAGETVILDERFLKSPGLALKQCYNVVKTMGEYAKQNLADGVRILNSFDQNAIDHLLEKEDAVDIMEDRVGNYLIRISDKELSENESHQVSQLLHLINELERISDYCVNLTEGAQKLHAHGIAFSKQAKQELDAISQAVSEILQRAYESFVNNDVALAQTIEPLEEVIDTMQATLKDRHIERLRQGTCTIDAGIVFLETLTNLERISDHCSNIALYIIGYDEKNQYIDRHAYIKELHTGSTEAYSALLKQYSEKYFPMLEAALAAE